MGVLKDKRVLVVDDEEGIRDLVSSELEFNGAICYQAENGQDAFEIYRKEKMDVVISDIRMPNGDGLFFLDKIKENQLNSCTMIFMTGFSDVPIEEFYDRGVEAVLSKPFRLEQMMATIEMALTTPRMAWRRAPRVVAVLNIELDWSDSGGPVKAKTFNVGRGGMFIQIAKQIPKIGTRVRFNLSYHFEGKDEALSGELVVRWVRLEPSLGIPSGFGGEFIDLSTEQMDEIAAIVGLACTRVYIPKK